MSDGERRVSDEIISVAQTAKQSGGSLKRAEESFPAEKKTPGCCGEEEEVDLDTLKQELDMDDHIIVVTELLKRLNDGTTDGYISVKFSPDEDGVVDVHTPFEIDQTKLGGLNSAAVSRKIAEFGENVLTPPKTKSECEKFVEQITDFFSILLWVGCFLCFVAYGLQSTVDNLALAIVLGSVVLITGVFGYFQDKKASNLMESFKNMMPEVCTVVREGGDQVLDASKLVPGDIVKIKYGEQIPADVRILWATDDMAVDNSSLTGEPEAIRKTNAYTEDNPLETSNLAFFGTTCPKGQAIAIVVRTGDRTVMGRIARLTTSTDTAETPINREINHFVHIISGVAIFLGVLFFGLGFAVGTYWASNLAFMIGIIVANVPEGLLITVTVCLTLTANRMASNSVIVKNLKGVETLGSTTCICSDKTGTLTQNIMTVQNLCFDGEIYNANCGSRVDNINRDSKTYDKMIRVANVCNTAKFDQKSKSRDGAAVPFSVSETLADGSSQTKINWRCIGDATESSLIKFIQALDIDVDDMRNQYKQLGAIPFNSANKYMVSVNTNPDTGAPLVTMKGAPERVLARCSHAMVNGEIVELEGEVLARIEQMQTECSANGLRVLGFAEYECEKGQFPDDYKYETENPNFPIGNEPLKKFHPASYQKLVFLGLYAIIDPPRPQVKDAVAKCKAAGIRVIMVTGDHPATAKAIAKQVGIIWGDSARGGAIDGPATQDDYEKYNEERGLSEHHPVNDDGDRYLDPRLAPAIVVPGWEIDAQYSDYWERDEAGEKMYKVSPEKWDDILGHTQIVFARTSPQQKLIIVENCQLRGEIVAVTGDGVNDAPALKKADIGVAMGITGSEVSKQAADMILMDDNFASIVAGIEEGRLIFDNLKKSIAYTLSSNIPEIAPFLMYITIQIPQALSTILILFVDLGTDMVPAISMAWENAESDIMRRPPRNAKVDRLVTSKLIFFAYLQIGVIQALAGFFTFFVVMHDYGFPAHILFGLAQYDNYATDTLFCKNNAPPGQVQFVTVDYDPLAPDPDKISDVWTPDHFMWLDTSPNAATRFGDERMSCTFATRNVLGAADGDDFAHPDTRSYCGSLDATRNLAQVQECFDPANRQTYYSAANNLYTGGVWVASFEEQINLINSGYVPYTPFKGRTSAFWDNTWLHQDIYGDYNDFASAVPGLGQTIGVQQRVNPEIECTAKTLDSSATCDPKWTNFDQSASLTPLLYFGFQPLPRYITHMPVVDPVLGRIPKTPAEATTASCGVIQPGLGAAVCDLETAKSAASNYLLYADRYGVDIDTTTGERDIDLIGAPVAEVMDRRGLEELSSNTFALTQYWLDCEETGFECASEGNSFPQESHAACQDECTLLRYGFDHAQVLFSTDSIYGAGFSNLDWSNYRDLGCDPTVDYGTQLGENPVTSLTDENHCLFKRRGMEFNVASRMAQREALSNSQAAYFVCIVVVQWADLLICKTRMNSIREQGMLNFFMNFGLIFETVCAVILCYTPGLNTAIGFRPLRFLHWTPGVPYSFLIFAYDEIRKFMMRRTSWSEVNKVTGQSVRKPGWLERNSYY